MNPGLVWTLTAALMLLGVAGSVLPGLPGAPIILAAAILHYWLLPGYVSVWSLALLGLLALLSLAADLTFGALGARAFGGSRRGAFAAPIGALLGLPFGLFGIIIGAVLGAAAAEAFLAGRDAPRALKAGVGAGLGVLAGTAARLGLALAMCAWLAADFLVN